jgi:PKD repeat protein
MNKNYLKTISAAILGFIFSGVMAQNSSDALWTKYPSTEIGGEKVRRNSFPTSYHLFQLDLNLLKTKLMTAPVLFATNGQSPLVLEFPNADGVYEKFNVYESSIMDPVLETKFPMIKTYAAQGIDDPTATMRFSVTQFGLHTMSISGIKSTVFIDPYTSDLVTYIVYDKNSLGASSQKFECLTDESVNLTSLESSKGDGVLSVQNINDQKLRTYRLAQSCNAEYGNIFAGTSNQKANIQAQMAITINRVNSVYERDLAIHLNFVANNDLIIYYGSTTADPWSTEWNTKTAQTIDAAIGVSNYDIGHNFNTSGGGNAGCLSCVCLSSSQSGTHKGRGYTGSSNPTGDAFDIDYVAHEMGHQFGGYHVMNTCSRSGNGSTEVEPASGSSIMGYAGICSSNVQNNSHADFAYVNIRDISNNIKTGNSSSCAAITTLTNTPPTASAGLDYTVPISTPYILEGSGTDVNGAASLTYAWAQNDATQSPGTGPPQSTYSVGPLYRALPPSISPNRYMPAITTVLANSINSTWEKTPSVGRVMNFSFIVRDNGVGGGQTASDLMKVTASAAAGPFSVTSQNTATTWTAATTQTVTWNVANTNTGAVNTPSVNIFLSTQGGTLYPTVLASNVPNNGSAVITVPSTTVSGARLMVRGAGNIFYDINNAGITIVAAPVTAAPVSNFSVATANQCTGSSIQLTDQSLNTPTSWTWTAISSTGVVFSNPNAKNPTVTFASAGTYTISLTAQNSLGSSSSTKTVSIKNTPTVSVTNATVCAGNNAVISASGATSFNWSTGAGTSSITVSPSSNTSYTVTGTTNGCSASKVSNVTVNNLPSVSLTPASTVACTTGGTVNLVGSPTGGTFSGTGVSGNAFNPAVSGAGTHTVTYSYTNTNSCTNSTSKSILVNVCTGIEELNTQTFVAYPNPTSGDVRIDFTSATQTVEIEVFDAIGKLVLTQKANNDHAVIALNEFSKGIYTLRLKSEGTYSVIRIIKE